MGTRTIKQTTEKQIQVCDLCNKAIGHCQTCYVCRRECGYCCGGLIAAYDPKDTIIVELSFILCKDCREAGDAVIGTPLIESARSYVTRCNDKLEELFTRWRAWSKQRREKANPEAPDAR